MISVANITKSFGNQTVLKNFSFNIGTGESLALLGLSGSGKTTALKIICGLHLPDQGQVTIAGLHLSTESLPLIRKKIGYVIQDGGLFPHLTAWENIALIGRESLLSAEEINARIKELCILTKISIDLLDRYPAELSGGQRQRVGIMRALFLDPEILLLDEPLGALDPITRRELQFELKDLIARLKKTVVLVTHDLYEATYLADRIILLSEGKIIQEGTMNELTEKPASDFVKTFVVAQNHSME